MWKSSLRLSAGALLMAGCGLTLGQGCGGGGNTLGAACVDDTDCSADQFCNAAFVCEARAGSDGGADSGGGDASLDSGAVDGATDAGTDSSSGDTGTGDTGTLDSGTADTGAGDTGVADTGPTCVDLDMDGVTDCAGDCDDTDPTVYPGAPEICGDGVANDCGGVVDAGCGGLGTYVAKPPIGNNANPGTQAAPVATIAQGISNAMTIGGGVDVYVAEGTYSEAVDMVEGITLWGGYESTGWTRDPAAHVTRISATTGAGVNFRHGLTNATAIDGFTILGHMGGGTAAAVTIADGSSPEVRNNIIRSRPTSGANYAVNINPADRMSAGTPLIQNNDLFLANAGGGWGGGNGSWGVRSRQTAAQIIGNRVTLANADIVQRGVEVFNSPAGTRIEGNVVRGAGDTDVGFGIRAASSAADILDNDVDVGRCGTFCIGIEIGGNATTVNVLNNVAFGGGGGDTLNVALNIAFERLPSTAPDILVENNFLAGGSGGSGLSAGVWLGERPAAPFIVGRFRNNVLYSGTSAFRFAMFENHPNIDPETLENNAFHLETRGATMGGGLYMDEGSATLTSAAMINGLGTASGNLEDDCSVVTPSVGGDLHLSAGSACIDAGTNTEAPSTDFEGDARPAGGGVDIGPDEAG